MQLNKLPKIIKDKKRIGRGYGSGKGGHASSRGQKGQKSRGSIDPLFEGTKMRKSLIKRMPFLRGKGRNKSMKKEMIIINLKYLDKMPANTEVNPKNLLKYGLITKDQVKKSIKILGEGEIKKALKIMLPISKQAAKKIIKAGGTVGDKVEETKKRTKKQNK